VVDHRVLLSLSNFPFVKIPKEYTESLQIFKKYQDSNIKQERLINILEGLVQVTAISPLQIWKWRFPKPQIMELSAC
jgi:hypothetical protein